MLLESDVAELQNTEWAKKLATELKPQYRAVKILPDGSVAALQDLMFTRAILLGCDEWCFTNRFCFEDRDLADKRLADLGSEDDEPAGYIARRKS